MMAQSARDYVNVPVNEGLLIVDLLQNTSETTAAESGIPLPNSLSISRSGFASYVWSFPMGGRYAGVQVTDGYLGVKGSTGDRVLSGFSDPSFSFHANIFGPRRSPGNSLPPRFHSLT